MLFGRTQLSSSTQIYALVTDSQVPISAHSINDTSQDILAVLSVSRLYLLRILSPSHLYFHNTLLLITPYLKLLFSQSVKEIQWKSTLSLPFPNYRAFPFSSINMKKIVTLFCIS